MKRNSVGVSLPSSAVQCESEASLALQCTGVASRVNTAKSVLFTPRVKTSMTVLLEQIFLPLMSTEPGILAKDISHGLNRSCNFHWLLDDMATSAEVGVDTLKDRRPL